MRLIDADKLETEIEELIRVRYEWISDSKAERRGLNIALCYLEDAPTVDAVPVVRCKECKYWDDEDHACGLRDCYGWDYKPYSFCSWAERRSEDEAD